MLASVHVVDSNPIKNLVRRTPKPKAVAGLRWAHKLFCAQLGAGMKPDVQPGRGGFVAWWDDDAALDAFLETPGAAPYKDGWSVRLRPTRSRPNKTWPGIDFQPFPETSERHDGVHAAITTGTAKVPSVPRFFKVSGDLEQQFIDDPNARFGIGMTLLPRVVLTLTFWNDQDSTDEYVRSGPHGEAMKNHYDFPTEEHEFVIGGGFFGFEPYGMTGALTGKNPTPAGLLG